MKWLIATFALAATIAVIAATVPPTVEALSPDEALLSLFPANSGGVIFVDVAELRDNPLVRENFLDRPGFELPNRVAEFAAQTGLDPETDVDQVMLGRTGENEFLSVARANYDPLKNRQSGIDPHLVGNAFQRSDQIGGHWRRHGFREQNVCQVANAPNLVPFIDGTTCSNCWTDSRSTASNLLLRSTFPPMANCSAV